MKIFDLHLKKYFGVMEWKQHGEGMDEAVSNLKSFHGAISRLALDSGVRGYFSILCSSPILTEMEWDTHTHVIWNFLHIKKSF